MCGTFITIVCSIFRCTDVDYSLPKRYYRVKTCYKLNTSIVAKSKITTLSKCSNYAAEKQGLAFNFSPFGNQDYDEDEDYFMNCEVLGCPDTLNLTSLVNDSRFDYYSLYGNTEDLMYSTCIPSVGVFQYHTTKENYTLAQNVCQSMNGNLPHIVDEIRTLYLGRVLKTHRLNWNEAKDVLDWDTVAYVDLNDRKEEGKFVTSKGEPIECFRYRAWAPGHPRRNKKKDDCVIIDDDKTWRAVNCAKKLSFFCEIEPKPLFWNEYKEFLNSTCSGYTNKTIRRKCKKVKKKYHKAQKSIVYEDDMDFEDRCEDI